MILIINVMDENVGFVRAVNFEAAYKTLGLEMHGGANLMFEGVDPWECVGVNPPYGDNLMNLLPEISSADQLRKIIIRLRRKSYQEWLDAETDPAYQDHYRKLLESLPP